MLEGPAGDSDVAESLFPSHSKREVGTPNQSMCFLCLEKKGRVSIESTKLPNPV